MRKRLLLGGLVAGLALSFAPAAPASASCHHWPWLCNLVDDLGGSIACVRGVTC